LRSLLAWIASGVSWERRRGWSEGVGAVESRVLEWSLRGMASEVVAEVVTVVGDACSVLDALGVIGEEAGLRLVTMSSSFGTISSDFRTPEKFCD
jgi:hypothetical protein